jgi:alkylated DNA repair dioxygenase AlkB
MNNMKYFNKEKTVSIPKSEVLTMPDADVLLYRGFFDKTESDAYLHKLLNEDITWRREINRFGVPQPRDTAWYGDEGTTYIYSGITNTPKPWTPTLLAIKTKIEDVTDVQFNSVLLNRYRSERDSISWHSDNEHELGTNSVIGSISFGATRRFHFRHKQQSALRLQLELTHGSLLLMRGTTQHFWEHRVPKVTSPRGERINLTFRVIYPKVKERT